MSTSDPNQVKMLDLGGDWIHNKDMSLEQKEQNILLESLDENID